MRRAEWSAEAGPSLSIRSGPVPPRFDRYGFFSPHSSGSVSESSRPPACPIDGSGLRSGFECIDTNEEIEYAQWYFPRSRLLILDPHQGSCGGCSTMHQGMDCNDLPGVKYPGCREGKCLACSSLPCCPSRRSADTDLCLQSLAKPGTPSSMGLVSPSPKIVTAVAAPSPPDGRPVLTFSSGSQLGPSSVSSVRSHPPYQQSKLASRSSCRRLAVA